MIAVEGYVDVIAMVTAGFPATVAPLGTALTEDQLALLWKMADEPMLCFDGDNAGLRAAYRAVELAMPRLKPGKSLKFALLPQGQDPDDLVRSGGRDAVNDVIGAARPLADMLWARETEGQSFDTPERRAALEARINEVIAGSATRRCENITGRISTRGWRNSSRRRKAAARQFQRGPGAGVAAKLARARQGQLAAAQRRAAAPGHRRQEYALCGGQPAARRQPGASRPSHRGTQARGADPAGRAELSLAAARPPGGVRLAGVPPWRCRAAEMRPGRYRRPCRGGRCRGGTRRNSPERGLAEAMERIAASITTASVWGARPDASPEDVLVTWQQLVALHRQWHSLTKELKDAEQALGQDNCEANYLRLRDVKARLARMEGTEALIEGFGASSGRGVRSL